MVCSRHPRQRARAAGRCGVKVSYFVLGCVFSAVVAATAVVNASDTPTVFRGGVDLVALNVVVTDGQNKPVGGLSPEKFTVLEDGIPQDVTFFAAQQVPLDLAILLD